MKKNNRKKLRIILIIFFVGLIAAGVIMMIPTFKVFIKAGKTYEEYDPEEDGSMEELGAVAWLKVDDTGIDHPVMQGNDNREYLNKAPDGTESYGGSIYLDYRNKADFSDELMIIYGHHMQLGYMFGALDDFRDKEYLESHSTGRLILKDGTTLELRIFASMEEDSGSSLFSLDDKEIDIIKDKAFVYTKDPKGPVVMMCTCTEDMNEMRTMVFAEITDRK